MTSYTESLGIMVVYSIHAVMQDLDPRLPFKLRLRVPIEGLKENPTIRPTLRQLIKSRPGAVNC